MNLVLGRWVDVPCCGLCAASLTFNFHIIQIIPVSHLPSMHSTLSVCSWAVYPVGQYMGKISFALNVFSDQLFTSLEVITSLGNISFFVFLRLLSSCAAVTLSCPTLGTFQWKTVELSIQLSWGCTVHSVRAGARVTSISYVLFLPNMCSWASHLPVSQSVNQG